MFSRLFYRNIQARDNLELFLVSAASSLLILRFVLYLAGYPQVGSGSLHIAHMLWGGVLMVLSIVLLISFIGARVQRLAAFIGGVGFGIFIDELGKFITKDNDYFFRPTVGIIYAVFILLYLAFSALSRRGHFSSREYQLNALMQFEEAIAHDLDPKEKRAIASLLRQADNEDNLTQELQKLLHRLDTVKMPVPNRLQQFEILVSALYQKFWYRRHSLSLIRALFIIEAVVFTLITILNVLHNLDDVRSLFSHGDSYSKRLIIGQVVSSLMAAIFAIAGAIRMTSSRLQGFELLRTAILINLFLTEFFVFSRLQFRAMPGFIVNLILVIVLRLVIVQEQQSQ